MTPEQQAAYIQAQASCALIEAFGMMTSNMIIMRMGGPAAYDEPHFAELIARYGISHNAVIGFFREGA